MPKIFTETLKLGLFETWNCRPESDFIHITQVHGTDIVPPEASPCEADGIVVSIKDFNRPIAIKTADCLPIIIEGEEGIVFLHAGWRGLANKILEKSEINYIKPKSAYIGPSIQECCFEVSSDFRDNFKNSLFFKIKKDKLFFNLQEEAKQMLLMRYPGLSIQAATICTCCDLRFNSFRRDKTKERNWNLFKKG